MWKKVMENRRAGRTDYSPHIKDLKIKNKKLIKEKLSSLLHFKCCKFHKSLIYAAGWSKIRLTTVFTSTSIIKIQRKLFHQWIHTNEDTKPKPLIFRGVKFCHLTRSETTHLYIYIFEFSIFSRISKLWLWFKMQDLNSTLWAQENDWVI